MNPSSSSAERDWLIVSTPRDKREADQRELADVLVSDAALDRWAKQHSGLHPFVYVRASMYGNKTLDEQECYPWGLEQHVGFVRGAPFFHVDRSFTDPRRPVRMRGCAGQRVVNAAWTVSHYADGLIEKTVNRYLQRKRYTEIDKQRHYRFVQDALLPRLFDRYRRFGLTRGHRLWDALAISDCDCYVDGQRFDNLDSEQREVIGKLFAIYEKLGDIDVRARRAFYKLMAEVDYEVKTHSS